MDGLFAKRVLIGLARMLSFYSIHRCNYGKQGYCLKLVNRHSHISMPLSVIYPGEQFSRTFVCKSAKWTRILAEIEGKSLGVRYNNGNPISIEQLIIDLELEGFLKNI